MLKSKAGFFYDNENSASSIQNNDAPVQHDNTNYTASYVNGRANVSSVRRYDVTNISLFTTIRTKYNTAGAVNSRKDASNHEVQISYSDSFSDNLSRNTLAYPTTVTDPDGFTATTKYHFDFGAVTYERTPHPTPNLAGPERFFSYDALGRLTQITNQANGSYTRYVYASTMTRLDIYATFQAGLGEAYSFKLMDGAGRVIALANEHPGSAGGYSGQRFAYDVMGRLSKSSNPAETSAVGTPSQWATTGDDLGGGWIYKQQTYDWKGRPLVVTNADGLTTQTISYSGCGCAGGEVITLADEGTLDGGVAKRREQKIYSDVLGRTIKTETLNWQGGSVYSATVNTYNALDQITHIRQYAGAEGSGTYQDTTMSYDGYGRLSSRHLPEQDLATATVWTYNADDTINTVTDARGAVTTFGYNGTGRHLVKSITHTLTGSPTVSASFEYDGVGNRTSMTDGLGTTTYTRNQLSQLTSETRNITGVGSFTLNYTYNLGGQLNSVTDPFGAQVSYNYDKIGRLSSINGANFASVTTYASNFQYRAWGALKSLTYGNSKTLALGYDVNQNVSTYEIPGLMKKSYQYYDDGRLKSTQDQLTTNSKFDRLYKYDHVGRITTALSGAEARGQGPTNDRPYNETMAYDPLGHLTLREIRNWDRWDTTGNETYINNRRQYWQYDADGRLLSGSSQYTYDAAGQISTFGDSDPYETDQQLDGDGRRIKSVQRRYDLQTNQWVTEKITYYIHSSVIGQVISEVSATGAKERSFVFAGGKVIAIQTAIGGQFVSWEHYDASGASYRPTNSTGQPGLGKEMDPLGANAGVMKPFNWPPPNSPGKLEPYYGISELNSPYQGCELSGIPAPCSVVTGTGGASAFGFTIGGPDEPFWPADWHPDFVGWVGLKDRKLTAHNFLEFEREWLLDGDEWKRNSPDVIANDSEFCSVSISFTDRNHLFKNGPGERKIPDVEEGFGVGFTVTGVVKQGEIGKVQLSWDQSDTVNPNGQWTVQQWVAESRQITTDKTGNRIIYASTSTEPDGPRAPFRQISGNRIKYFDFPGPITPMKLDDGQVLNMTSFRGEYDFDVKLVNGKQQCEVKFHISMSLKDGVWTATWGIQ